MGAGIGSNSFLLANENVKSWLCLEPDERLLDQARNKLQKPLFNFKKGVLANLKEDEGRKFHTILYVDVLEHIEHDKDELELSLKFLHKNGSLIILSPAHIFLFSL